MKMESFVEDKSGVYILPIRCLILLIDAFDMHGFWLGFPFNMLGYSRMCRYYIFLEDIQRINTK
jgi:hypothetical protein